MEQNRNTQAPQDIVLGIQKMLLTLSRADPEIGRVNLTGSYDVATAASVESFQRREDLPVTGEVDEETFSVLLAAYIELQEDRADRHGLYPFDRPLEDGQMKAGDQFDLVTILQCMIDCISASDDGMEEQPITGIYDDVTRRNVLRFQEQNGIAAHGNVDRVTWDRMADLYNAVLNTQY